MAVIKVDTDKFDELVLKSDKKVLVDFYADWCGPCKMVAPIVEELADEHPEHLIVKVNVDEEPSLSMMYGVMSIPTLLVLKEGKILNRLVGARPKEFLLELLEG